MDARLVPHPRSGYLGVNPYFWNVQAVDASYAGGPFASEEGTFVLDGSIDPEPVLPVGIGSTIGWIGALVAALVLCSGSALARARRSRTV
jgi:hypothetical protein